ncbi:MAG: HAD family phosphatase [Candidatus Binatia bacterium]|nr:HAD family phosphatase [Candidatus Binatia bacterium]
MSSANPTGSAAVVFDLDGVLLDSEGLHYQAYCQVLREFDVVIGQEEYAEHWIGAGHGPEYAVERYRLPITPTELRARKAPLYRELLHTRAQLMPHARDVVEGLYREFALGVATNSGREDVDWVLARFDLRRFFSAVIAREDYREAKPAPDAYVAVRALLAVPAHRCLVVEDSPRGVLAARAAGLPVVAVPNEFTRVCVFPPGTPRIAGLSAVTPAFVRAQLDRADGG